MGETDNVGKRLADHNKDDAKEFWEQTCIVTSKDQNLTKAHVRYLEGRLIAIATEAGRAKLVNGTAPNFGLLPEADLSDMEFFIEQLRVVLPVLGMDFLKETASSLLAVERRRRLFSQPAADDDSSTMTLADLELDQTVGGYSKSNMPFAPARSGSSDLASPVFELRDNKMGLIASAMEIDGEMVVLKGSQARKEEGDSLTGTLRQRRRELQRSGVLRESPDNPRLFVFATDVPLRSPSQSSSLILGRSDNGRLQWHVKGTGKTYADWQEEQVAAVAQEGGEE